MTCTECKFYEADYSKCTNETVSDLVSVPRTRYRVEFEPSFGCIFAEAEVKQTKAEAAKQAKAEQAEADQATDSNYGS
jgi:hypothetical protein